MSKRKWPIWLPDIENYTVGDWLAWFSIVIAVGAIGIGIRLLFI